MINQTVFFTGGTSGFGKIAACELANSGATVVVTYRNKEKAAQLQSYFKRKFENPAGTIGLIQCNLSSFKSVASAAKEFRKNYGKIDVLINNAGLWKNEYIETENGAEETFQVNVLSPLLLTTLLVDLLVNSENARIIFTASALHQGEIQFNDIGHKAEFKGVNTYRQSKLADMLLTRLLAEKLKVHKVGVYAQHPGVVKTELARESSFIMRSIFRLMGVAPQKGAQTLLYLATQNKEKLVSGEYYSKKKVTMATPYSNDLKIAEKLLQFSQSYLNEWMENKSVFIF